MQAAADATKSGMVAIIGLPVAEVQKICDESSQKSGKPISIANYLVDGNYAVSGAIEACEVAKDIAPTFGARMAVPLAVAGAFHTYVNSIRESINQLSINCLQIIYGTCS